MQGDGLATYMLPRMDSTPLYLWGEGHKPNEAWGISEWICGLLVRIGYKSTLILIFPFRPFSMILSKVDNLISLASFSILDI
jgi:hypothetical protein